MITRRDAARSVTVTALSYSRILGANDRIGLGVIGTGGRGTYVMGLFQKNSDVEVRALCDVYPARFREALASAPNARTFGDHRKLLELAEVDAVLIASPDHWHKDHAVDAMNAGKDVYSEKPMCRLREEAPVMVKTARATGRILQIGMQQRSGEIYLEPLEKFVKSGAIGKISHIDAVWHGGVPGPLRKEPARKPADLDWLRFLGPVAYRDWNPGDVLQLPRLPGIQRRQDDRLRPPLDGRRAHVHGRARSALRPTSPAASTTTAGRPHGARHLQRTVRVRRLLGAVPVQRVRRGARVRDHLLRRRGQAVRESQSLGVHAGRAATWRP